MVLIWHFQFNVGCSKVGLSILGIICISLALSIRVYASMIAITAALAASIAACVIASVMLCSDAIISYFQWGCLMSVCLLGFCLLVCFVWDFFSFYFWHHVMLLSLKDNNTCGSLWLCHLLYMLCMFYESGCICTIYVSILTPMGTCWCPQH